jgi:hypothetical protein
MPNRVASVPISSVSVPSTLTATETQSPKKGVASTDTFDIAKKVTGSSLKAVPPPGYDMRLVGDVAKTLKPEVAERFSTAIANRDDNTLLNILAEAEGPSRDQLFEAVATKVDREVAERTNSLLASYRPPQPSKVPPELMKKLIGSDVGAGEPLVRALLENFAAADPNVVSTLQRLSDAGFRFITNPAAEPFQRNTKAGALVFSSTAYDEKDPTKEILTGNVIYLNPRRTDVWKSLAHGDAVLRNELTNAIPIAEWQRLNAKTPPYSLKGVPEFGDLRQEVNGAVAEAQSLLRSEGQTPSLASTLDRIGVRAHSSNEKWLGEGGYTRAKSNLESAVIYMALTYGDTSITPPMDPKVMKTINQAGLEAAVRRQDLPVATRTADRLMELVAKARELAKQAGYDPETFKGNLPAAQTAIRNYLRSLPDLEQS